MSNKRKVKRFERIVVGILGVGLLTSLAFNKIQYEMVEDMSIVYENEIHEIKADNELNRSKLMKEFDIMRDKENEKEKKIELLESELKKKETEIKKLAPKTSRGSTLDTSKMTALGEFEITNYTLSPDECSKEPSHPYYGITASGKTATVGETVATDWSVIPKGTKIYIEGIGTRIAQDTGNLVKGKIIDVFIGDPQNDKNVVDRANTFGRQKRRVWIVND